MTLDDTKMVNIDSKNSSIIYELIVNDGYKYLVCSKSISGAVAKVRRFTGKSVILRSVKELQNNIL